MWVLIVVLSTGSLNGGVGTLAQEFNTRETCEVALTAVAQAHGYASVIRARGCFKK